MPPAMMLRLTGSFFREDSRMTGYHSPMHAMTTAVNDFRYNQ